MSGRWVVDDRRTASAPRTCTDRFGHEMDPAHQCEAVNEKEKAK